MPLIPPIKSQGIKSKLVAWIQESLSEVSYARWVEPFMGTGVVAFNLRPTQALLCDSNPHLIRFYQALQQQSITPTSARSFLEEEGKKLSKSEGAYYYEVRERFNQGQTSLDFLFLNRSCFNGMMRFNRKGGFNVPFCKKPQRFSPALVSKICNQIQAVQEVLATGNYKFVCQDFSHTLSQVASSDLIYCDPPYIGRHVDYFNSWSESEEHTLKSALDASGARYVLSSWLKNKYRSNEYLDRIWQNGYLLEREHFYHLGGREQNRNAITEVLLANFPLPKSRLLQEIKLA